ncbi:subclass B3 metallo-beta-lactamase [Luteibacter sp.]|jgi:metallo-beta-lactamase class B|uniref:subclass B3 metallo-beta-lactamase n=1 Tax=Luteibacter sp. TaxID=1886636 RepID=UPI002F41B1E4
MRRTLLALAACIALPALAVDTASWTQPAEPHVIYGNTYFVGTKGISAVLITSPQGHVLIDGTLEENVSRIEESIRKLGFRVEDIKVILNSHAHFDHAGGIAGLAKDSGATVRATVAGSRELRLGGHDASDPQHGEAKLFPGVNAVGDIAEGTVVRIGPLAITAHITPGHTAGGTAWTWESCEGKVCKSIAYVDSLSALAAGGYRYSDHPAFVAAFRKTFDRVAALPCDILVAPHPEQAVGKTCKSYADDGRKRLDKQLAKEASR